MDDVTQTLVSRQCGKISLIQTLTFLLGAHKLRHGPSVQEHAGITAKEKSEAQHLYGMLSLDC